MLSDKMEKLWNKFSDEGKETIETSYQTLRAEYMTLQEIRKQKNITQDDMARLLGIKQENVCRIESRDDMKLSTLQDYIEALGGEIQVNAVFPDNTTINILKGKSENQV